MKKKLFFVVLLGLLLTSTAFAQKCPPKPANEKRSVKVAGQWFAKASRRFDEGRYVASLEAFFCSLSIVEHENTITNIEKGTEKVADQSVALAMVEEYLADFPESQFTERLTEFKESLMIDLGLMEEEVEKPPPPPPPPPPPEPVVVVELESKADWMPIVGWTGIALGGVLAVTGAFFASNMQDAESDANKAANYALFKKHSDNRDRFKRGTIISFISSGTLLAASATILFVDAIKKSKNSDVEISLLPTGNGLILRGKF